MKFNQAKKRVNSLLIIVLFIIFGCSKKKVYYVEEVDDKATFKQIHYDKIYSEKYMPLVDMGEGYCSKNVNQEINFEAYIKGKYSPISLHILPYLISNELINYPTNAANNTKSYFNLVKDPLQYNTNYYIEVFKGNKIYICQEKEESYPKNSLQAAAISASNSVNKAYIAVNNTLGENLPEIDLHIMPLVANVEYKKNLSGEVTKIVRYLTDNAAYSYENSKGSIYFYPQSETAANNKGPGSIPYWFIPMVGAHEYGHHVFTQLVYKKVLNKVNQIHLGSCWKKNAVDFEQIDFIKKQSDHVRILNGFNEGFADLISFYSLGPDDSKLTGVPDLEKDRDVDERLFSTGIEKKLTKDILDFFFYKNKKIFKENFYDTHIIGAIFAYGINRIMQYSYVKKELRLKVILEWVKSTNLLIDDLVAGRNTLDPTEFTKAFYEKFLIALRDYGLSQAGYIHNACKNSSDTFPVLHPNEVCN